MPVQSNVIQVFEHYFGNFLLATYFIAAFAYWCCRSQKKYRRMMLITIVFYAVLCFNDFFYRLCQQLGVGKEYYRFLWGIPVIILSAVFLTDLVARAKVALVRLAIVLVVFLSCFAVEKSFLSENDVSAKENIYGVSNNVVNVSNIVEYYRREEKVLLLGDLEINHEIRSCNGHVVIPFTTDIEQKYYAKETIGPNYQNLLDFVNGFVIWDEENLKDLLADWEIQFVVMRKEWKPEKTMERLGYYMVGRESIYEVYTRK